MKRLCTLLVVVCACGGQGPKETNEGGAPVTDEAKVLAAAPDAGIQGTEEGSRDASEKDGDAGASSADVEPPPEPAPEPGSKTLRFEWCHKYFGIS